MSGLYGSCGCFVSGCYTLLFLSCEDGLVAYCRENCAYHRTYDHDP